MQIKGVSTMAFQYESIQDFLVAQGFTIDQEQERFARWVTGWQFVAIPFAEIAGHTLPSFIQKARLRGWLKDETEVY